MLCRWALGERLLLRGLLGAIRFYKRDELLLVDCSLGRCRCLVLLVLSLVLDGEDWCWSLEPPWLYGLRPGLDEDVPKNLLRRCRKLLEASRNLPDVSWILPDAPGRLEDVVGSLVAKLPDRRTRRVDLTLTVLEVLAPPVVLDDHWVENLDQRLTLSWIVATLTGSLPCLLVSRSWLPERLLVASRRVGRAGVLAVGSLGRLLNESLLEEGAVVRVLWAHNLLKYA
jgi:hypothetical protein